MVDHNLTLDDSTDIELDDSTSAQLAPDTCTEDGCERDTHIRSHERDPQLGTRAHEDAPEVEAVCPRHDRIFSA